MVQVDDTVTGDRQLSEIMWVHNDTDVFVTEYGVVRTSGVLAALNVIISGSDVQLVATQVAANSSNYTVGVISLHGK